MAESLDRFLSAELVSWGKIKVVAAEDRADCLLSSGSGGQLSREFNGFGYTKAGAVEIVHKPSTVVVWAGAASDSTAAFSGGPKFIAKKLVAKLRKDYDRQRKAK